jgi:hypothetical protein
MANVGTFELRDGDAKRLGRILWRGRGRERGRWGFKPARGVSDEKAALVRQQISSAIASANDLASVSFRAPTGFDVFGWQGFWGFGTALRRALRDVGYIVEVAEGKPYGRVARADRDDGMPDDWVAPEKRFDPLYIATNYAAAGDLAD